MWYSGRTAAAPAVDAASPSAGCIGVAVSRDGLRWARGVGAVEGARDATAAADVGQVLQPNTDWWTFDTCHLAPGDVQVLSNSSVGQGVGVYWMFYSAGDYEEVPLPHVLPGAPCEPSAPDAPLVTLEGLRQRPGLALSQDGRNWARIEADHHTGALFDVGEPGEWDALFVGRPQVLSVGPRDIRMFYYSFCTRRQRYVVGLATSPDGFRWTKKGVVYDPADAVPPGPEGASAFDVRGAAAPCVVRDIDNRQYLMFYEAVAADGSRAIGLAVSKDGLKGWQRCPTPLLMAGPSEAQDDHAQGAAAWDSASVGAPCAVSMSGGKWRLYYCGRDNLSQGPWTGIGLARSVEGTLFENVPTTFVRHDVATA